jgi:hypothetical protein
MAAEAVVTALAPAVLQLLEQVAEAVAAGDAVRAAELAEEAARRQMLILRRRELSKRAPRRKR